MLERMPYPLASAVSDTDLTRSLVSAVPIFYPRLILQEVKGWSSMVLERTPCPLTITAFSNEQEASRKSSCTEGVISTHHRR